MNKKQSLLPSNQHVAKVYNETPVINKSEAAEVLLYALIEKLPVMDQPGRGIVYSAITDFVNSPGCYTDSAKHLILARISAGFNKDERLTVSEEWLERFGREDMGLDAAASPGVGLNSRELETERIILPSKSSQ